MQITPELYAILNVRSKEHRKQLTGEEQEISASGGKENSVITIQYDIPRTFAEDDVFQSVPEMIQALDNVLHCYAHYRPDVGYVQGMSYVAAMCVYYMDEYTAFQTLANLLSRRIHFDYYSLESNHILPYTLSFEHFFRRLLPGLHQHFKDEDVTCDQFLMDWTLTVFAKALPICVAARLWDMFVCEGEVFIIRAALGRPPPLPSSPPPPDSYSLGEDVL